MTEPTVAVPGQARREAEAAALEAAVVAAVTGAFAGRVGRVIGALRAGWQYARLDPARWAEVRRAAAGDLRRTRPGLTAALPRVLPRAAALGARHVDAALPAGWEPDGHLADLIDTADGRVTSKLHRAADHLTADPVDTDAKLRAAVDRVDVARREAAAIAGDAAAEAVTSGATAAADDADTALVWVSERDACTSCTAMAGAVRPAGGLFLPAQPWFAPRLIPWLPDGVNGPPAHGSCRCRVEVNTPGLVEALLREAQRDIARGVSAYDSLPARLWAVNALLRHGAARLPRSVAGRAAQDLARGRFSSRDVRGLRRAV